LELVVNPPAVIYMGRDKVENEDLIKYAWPQDVWFHVDKLSSAHVYLRMPDTIASWEAIPEVLLNDCAQLVKANSIEGLLGLFSSVCPNPDGAGARQEIRRTT
jgi:hypothetical protein